ncbi:MAG: cysteine--tRNA ligase [Candidatus Kapabacteria bacterium]|nr:cysteine--tRNA ligase [Candidatus Kapabacteria bacterium]MCX7937280.1 cysteine--tRNA ligase [Chlorobiota bacterium]
MEIHLYNTLSRQVERFEPIEAGRVRMYSCGPTVYNHVHIGNLRAFLCADLLQRVLRVIGGYHVQWVMNITDIDDKTIRDSQPGSPAWNAEAMGPQTDDPQENLRRLTRYYEQVFLRDIEAIGIRRDDFFAMPRATDYIPAMMELIRLIWQNGYAYVAGGSVYFDLSRWIEQQHPYGVLFTVDLERFIAGARIDADQYERDEVSDFVLWKARKEGEPWWVLELGGQLLPGRPGWHIECSAMGHELLGLPFDIHTGGVDLRFPHHEDEIAQSAAGYGCITARYWVHNEFLEVEGEKMSKSLGNFYTLSDLIERGLDPLDVRYAILSAHYQSVYNFTFEGVAAARRARRRVQEYIYQLFEHSGRQACDVEALEHAVFGHLADNLHTPKALAALFTFLGEHPAATLEKNSQRALVDFFERLNRIIGVWQIGERPPVVIPERIRQLAEERWRARLQRDFARADALRQQIAAEGYIVRDRTDGYDIVPHEE